MKMNVISSLPEVVRLDRSPAAIPADNKVTRVATNALRNLMTLANVRQRKEQRQHKAEETGQFSPDEI